MLEVDADRSAAKAELVAGINHFSLGLYRQLSLTAENLCLSPASVSLVFGLAYRGAIGPTATEIAATFQFKRSPSEHGAASLALIGDLEMRAPDEEESCQQSGPDDVDGAWHEIAAKPAELCVINALWLQEGMKLREDFAADAAAEHAMGVRRVDYRRDAAAALATINAAVASATRQLITNLLSPSDISTETRITLTNALYWKGCWLEPFNERNTELAPFALADGGSAFVRMMHQTSHFRVLERDGAKAIILPFLTGHADREVSMVVILPDEADSLPRFEAALDDDGLAGWLRELDAADGRYTDLALPRMCLNWSKDLAPALRAMGLSLSFEDAADFSGMAVLPDPADPDPPSLTIGNVIHKTVFKIDEHGCEAAAATAMAVRAGAFSQPPLFEFRADKPFLFLLRDDRSGLILFIGRHMVPNSVQAGGEGN